jgi:hypothetical protein
VLAVRCGSPVTWNSLGQTIWEAGVLPLNYSRSASSEEHTTEKKSLATRDLEKGQGRLMMDASVILEVIPMPEPTYEELKAKLAELEKQGPRRTGSLEFRVSEKGGVSVYGLGRFPVTLYYEQWTRLLDASDKLREFLEENKSKLKLKGQ